MNKFILKLGFLPKENSSDVFIKKYQDNFEIEVNFTKEKINYGKIKTESETTSNLSQSENWVVLECVDRLLEKGYKPEDIILENTWKTGHGTSGRLDILVKKEGKSFLMIECKTWGREFEKEYKNLQKDGGQLFTYFQQDNNADFLLLYTSKFDEEKNELEYKNKIVVIEKSYRETSNVKDLFKRWNKFSKDNGIFEDWVGVYDFQSKSILNFIGDGGLKEISPADSGVIFNEFLEILRRNVVSDKPNAFNKIFTLFLCKIIDEAKTLPNQPLKFQWFETPQSIQEINEEGKKIIKKYPADDDFTFQKRLADLYVLGMQEFLKKEVQAFGEKKLRKNLGDNLTEKEKDDIVYAFVRDILRRNNEFAIKEVFDQESFEDNAVVVREIVKLIAPYQVRYPQKQQHLSDFFELLLTTGLKQESGQFFTPVPIARFICKSVPLVQKTIQKLHTGGEGARLPNIIDYSVGSGHFLTESMDEVQNCINELDSEDFFGPAKNDLQGFKANPFGWAMNHIYGIEKDYRLVKVAKVGCYFYGDGLASVIHGDGLDSFKDSKNYSGFLKEYEKESPAENKQFDFVLSNPPYSVSGFKTDINKIPDVEKNFELYKYLTDQSSEIEALFIERTAQLLKERGIAALILPSSILSNSGIYTKAREILLKNFEFVAITELGSNTFMATGTNTVVLFLKRRSTTDFENIQNLVKKNLSDKKDVTINGIEKSFSKYLQHVWEDVSFEDYRTLLEKNPNEQIKNHDIFVEYEKKIKAKNETEKWQKIFEIEQEKITYFLLTYSQKVVLVKTGEKKAEKQFLGYEFSFRRGSEGIHPIQRGKQIDECTKLFDPEDFYNPEKASTYILEAFEEKKEREISKNLQKNISRVNLLDMLTFDRADFEKTISLNVKKKIQIESRWELVRLGDISKIDYGTRIVKNLEEGTIYPVYGGGGETFKADSFNRENCYIFSRFGMSPNCIRFVSGKFFLNDSGMTLYVKQKLLKKYLDYYLFLNQGYVYDCGRGVSQKNIDIEKFNAIKIPLPPKEIQQKIVNEIEVLEKKEEEMKGEVESMKTEIEEIIENSEILEKQKLGDVISLEYGKPLPENKRLKGDIPVMGSNGIVGFHNEKFVYGPSIIVGRKGSAGKVNWINQDNFPIDTTFYVKILDAKVNLKFIYFVLKKLDLEKLGSGTGVPGLNRNDAYSLTFGFPSSSEQQKIVSEIEKIEEKISELKKNLSEIPKQKEEVLKKYL